MSADGRMATLPDTSERHPQGNPSQMRSQKLVSGPWPQAPQEPRESVARRALPRVLVADDERSMRELLAIVLRRERLRGDRRRERARRRSTCSRRVRWICSSPTSRCPT